MSYAAVVLALAIVFAGAGIFHLNYVLADIVE